MKRFQAVSTGISVLTALSIIGGCASSELNYNTLDLASTTNDLMMQQVFFNLANFIDSDLAYPAQAVISSGTASTADTASANVTTPLSSAVTATSQFVRTVAATSSTALTGVGTSVRSGASLGLTGTALRSQNWAYAPVTEAFRARRLMALYRYAVTGDDGKLLTDYPKIYQSVSHARNTCLTDDNGRPIIAVNPVPPNARKADAASSAAQLALNQAVAKVAEADKAAKDAAAKAAAASDPTEKAAAMASAKSAEKAAADAKDDMEKANESLIRAQRVAAETYAAGGPPSGMAYKSGFSRCVTSIAQPSTSGITIQMGSDTYSTMTPDPYYLKRPSCVLCLAYSRALDKSVLVVNPDLKGNWLHWRALPGASSPDNYGSNDKFLGQYGHYELFAAAGQEEKVAKFVVFVLAAATQSDTGGGAAAGGGGTSAGGGGAKAAAVAPQAFPTVNLLGIPNSDLSVAVP